MSGFFFQSNYWSMVRSLLPLWEQSLPGFQPLQPQQKQKQQKGVLKSASHARSTKWKKFQLQTWEWEGWKGGGGECSFMWVFICVCATLWRFNIPLLRKLKKCAWCYRLSAGTGQPSVSILWLDEVESLICNFYLSVAARKIVWADLSMRCTSMLLGR